MSSRRDFIKTSCAACALTVGASSFLSILLSSCGTALPVVKLASDAGSITVSADSFLTSKQIIVREKKLPFDILLVKKTDGTYNALYMQCTHADQQLNANNTGLQCNLHGSTFDLEGNVTRQPALRPLRKFKTEIKDSNLIIYLNS